MRQILTYFTLLFLSIQVSAQIVTIEPSNANGDQEIRLVYDATQGDGNLVGATKVYMHSGVVTDATDGTDWQHVIGNWGADDGIGQMTKVNRESDKWEITLSPTARDYYDVPEGTNMFRLSMVFRNADGSVKGAGTEGSFEGGEVTSNGDIYVDLDIAEYIVITSPTQSEVYIQEGEEVTFSGVASSEVSTMSLFIDEGNGFDEKVTVSSGTEISYTYAPTQSFRGTLRITATINGENVEVSQIGSVIITGTTSVVALPSGLSKGINYNENDATKATLVLEAPGKDFVLVVGDMNNWEIDPDYLMNVTPDGELFWLELDGLTPKQEYVFQYYVEGNIQIGDPYADKVADPWNDRFIPESVYPNLPEYSRTGNAIATVLQTDQDPFIWDASEDTWERPEKEDLVVYELLVRDFIGSHNYQDMIDTLDYIQNLGVNAIELMPIMEFEGNESWGYNPMYFFAPDKYYGTKNDLKEFIQACHQRGIAVVLDMVLNHAFGLNPMVRMYWDAAAGKPSADSPWFNPDATHPFNVGYDFNHESDYTKAFADSVNAYWVNEYHFDGYRFDLSKGFTQTNNPSNVGAWSAFDQSRVDILSRMANKLWETDPDAYVILEHFGDSQEETELASLGMLLWRNMGYPYWNALAGKTGESFSGATVNSHVSYMESHDEQRQLWEVFQEGLSNGEYSTRDTTIALERLKTNAAFLYMLPGPKMIWQFGELGYDYDINFNGRVGNKPLVWGPGNLGYYEDQLRKYTYDAFASVLRLRSLVKEESNVAYAYSNTTDGAQRTITIDSDDLDVVILGNFGLSAANYDYSFTETGDWFDYYSGETIDISAVESSIALAPGELKIFTSNKVSDGFPNVIEAYKNPVTISPIAFTKTDEITITFDATKASAAGTNGLVGASKVYMHAGVVLNDFNSSTLSNVVGTLTDDGVGEMTKVSGEDDKWEITITPDSYFNITDEEPVKIGMYFRDADNSNQGRGFRGSTIFTNVEVPGEIIEIAPVTFDQNTEITISYDARKGNKGLVGASKVYMHSGVVTDSESGTDWKRVVGNWGEDDGLGQMTRSSSNSDKWEITITPSEYYGLAGSVAFRLSFVFRSADGSQKGTGTPGEWANGIVDDNGDIFFDVPVLVTSLQEELPDFGYYPNPTQGVINFSGEIPGRIRAINIYNIKGEKVFEKAIEDNRLSPIDISSYQSGLYLLSIVTEERKYTMKVLVRPF